MNLRPEALQLISRINEVSARGDRAEISTSCANYPLALDLKRLGLLAFGERAVRNHIAYYRVVA